MPLKRIFTPIHLIYIANTYTITVACIYLINKQYTMLQVKKQVDVVCSAIGIKEAMVMLPIIAWICDGIKRKSYVNIGLTPEQCVAIGKVLGELGFVSELGENPLALIQELEAKNLESDIAEQRPE